jgi:hypothetical protein
MAWKINRAIRDRRSRLYGLVIAFIYFIVYLNSVGNLLFTADSGFLDLSVVPNWRITIFKPIAPYIWESIAVFRIAGGLSWFISVPNLLLDIFLSALVFLNIASAMYSYQVLPIRPGLRGLIGLVPSLFTGFACCVPTFIITLGAISTSFTMFFIEIRQILVPISVFIMAANLAWSLMSLKTGLVEIYENEKLDAGARAPLTIKRVSGKKG